AIENAPASSPATPARRTADALVDAPATPRTSDRLVSNPSPAPSTAARVVPPWTSRWRLPPDLLPVSQRPIAAARRAGGVLLTVLIASLPRCARPDVSRAPCRLNRAGMRACPVSPRRGGAG